MKISLILLSLFVLISCNDSPSENPAETKINTDFAKQHAAKPSENQNSIVEENNSCICTKEYNPVCGEDGRTYPSPCQAGCQGVENFTQGPCKK